MIVYFSIFVLILCVCLAVYVIKEESRNKKYIIRKDYDFRFNKTTKDSLCISNYKFKRF